MSVSQISVFIESEPGHLVRVLDSFVEAGVNVRGYSASDTGDYGIVRFIVDNPDAALAVLREQNGGHAWRARARHGNHRRLPHQCNV